MTIPTVFDPANSPWRDSLELMLESTGEAIFGIDLNGDCVFINRAGAELLGYEKNAILGQNMHQLTHHSHADGCPYLVEDCPIFNAFRQGLPCRIDSEVFWNSSGQAFPVEYSSSPIMNQGKVLGAVVTFIDITERKQTAKALQAARDDLELRVKERTQALSAALQQLRELSAYLDTVREQERTRIAREIHDELGSLLVALKMDVNWLERRLLEQQNQTSIPSEHGQRMQSKCHSMSSLIDTAVENVGRIITDLRPSILDHRGLWAALEWQALDFAQKAELALEWRNEITTPTTVSPRASLLIFRIFQEILSNIARHAQAHRVQISMQDACGQFKLRIQDDGRGALQPQFEATNAYGVMGMRERVRQLHGSLDITSQPGAGCLVEVLIPQSCLYE